LLLHSRAIEEEEELCFNICPSSYKQDNKTIAVKQEASKRSYKALVAAAIEKDTNAVNSP
jgi:hypothetical protein